MPIYCISTPPLVKEIEIFQTDQSRDHLAERRTLYNIMNFYLYFVDLNLIQLDQKIK